MGIFGQSKALIDEDWDKEFWGNNQAAMQFLKETTLLQTPKRILEIGSGKGYMLRYLVEGGQSR